MTERPTERARWTTHGERVIDDTRRARWSIAEVELPDGVRFDINEAERIGWISLDEVLDYITRGEIVGAASVVGLLDVLARRQRGELKA